MTDKQYIPLAQPPQQTVERNVAKVANVACAIKLGIQAEFPGFSVQRLLGCLELTDTPTEGRVGKLNILLVPVQGEQYTLVGAADDAPKLDFPTPEIIMQNFSSGSRKRIQSSTF